MVQKIHPRGVIWVPSSRLMWADQLKKIDSSSVHILRSPCLDGLKLAFTYKPFFVYFLFSHGLGLNFFKEELMYPLFRLN